MNCHACRLDLPDEAKFCAWCGAAQAAPCPGCHQPVNSSMRYCPQCGLALGATVPIAEPPRPAAPPRPDASGDRRVVTVLFTDVSGFTSMSEKLSPEEVTTIVNDFFAVLTEPIYRYGGVVDKYIGDAIMALFGAPVAHEDDPERAVRAGFEMQQKAAVFADELEKRTGIRLRVRIGIHTGLVVAGAVGGSQKRDYTVMGETVNLAQRMEAASKPGKVLVTEETYRYAAHAIDFLELEPITVKGKSEPIKVFEVAGLKDEAATHHEPRRFIGRLQELAKLRDCFQQAVDGTPQVVYLTGDAGIGKSQLSSELVQGLDPALAVVAQRVRAISYEQSTPYALLRELIRRLMGVKDNSDLAALLGKVQARIADIREVPESDRALVGSAIAYLLGQESEQSELAQLSPQQRRVLAFRSLNTLVLALARQHPVLLNFEDLHWADEASTEWLQSLFDALGTREYQHSRLLILCQARSVDGSPLARWRITQPTHTLVLRPLSESESWQLMGSLLETDADPGSWPEAVRKVASQVLARAEGNPMFLRELVKSLLDAGVLGRSESGHWMVLGEAGAKLPTNVNGVVLSRIDRLEGPQRSVLQLASVIGRSFQPSLVNVVGSIQDVDALLDDLARAEFVQRRSSGEWQFQQALIHEVVYNSLLIATRRDLHRRVGETLEVQLGDRREETPQLLARHFMLGELQTKALYFLFRSGEMAHRNFSNQEALHCFTECLSMSERGVGLPQGLQREQILLALSDLLATTGQYAPALQHLQDALALQADPTEQAETLRRMGAVYNLQGQFAEAMSRYDQGLNLLANQSSPLIQARILLDKGLSLFRQGQSADVIDLCEQSLRILAGTAHTKELAMAESILGIVTYRQARFSEAEGYHQRALALREQIQDVFGVASSLNNLGALYLELGDWARAADHYERALKIFQQIGDISRQIIQENNLGDLLRNRGELEQAEKLHRQALELSQQINDSLGSGIASSGVGMVLVAAGQHAEALESLQAGIETLSGINAVEVLPEPLAALSRAYGELGRFDEAAATADKALKQAQDNQNHAQIGLALSALATVRMRQSDFEGAQAAISEALSSLGEDAAPIEKARVWALDAEIQQRLGQLQAAARRAEEAREVFEKLGAEVDRRSLESVLAAPGAVL